ncbi:MAG: EscU/YscU/HrcU family type III secretion system export apparatus switch protein [Lentisphaeria bacterium]|nr:EscU/YscU/HrcU family type III secretion system export apparatus switch protein [Lentisphaeria bacterium]NQZ71330.1 EscU/YscU/HrcU family type III secretion system export apparatus switch protein [Lentisphaeria bacterium]
MPSDPSKTEEPTAKKIQESRRDGNVLMSQDIIALAVLTGGAMMVFTMVGQVQSGFLHSYTKILDIDCREDWSNQAFTKGVHYSFFFLCKILVPTMLGICFMAIVSTKAQIGSYFETQSLRWKLDQLNPISGFKQVLPTPDNLMKLGLVLIKLAIVSFFIYVLLHEKFDIIVSLPLLPVADALAWIVKITSALIITILSVFIIAAILDYVWKRHKYMDNLKMTKQEVSDEHKNAEGDPKLKARLRQKMQEMSIMRMIIEVPKADVIVTNPTHVSIALSYKAGTYAPVVVAKGLRKKAMRIREIAKDNDIPIIESPPLARTLYRNTKLGAHIPENLFGAVAAVLARIHKKKRKNYA